MRILLSYLGPNLGSNSVIVIRCTHCTHHQKSKSRFFHMRASLCLVIGLKGLEHIQTLQQDSTNNSNVFNFLREQDVVQGDNR